MSNVLKVSEQEAIKSLKERGWSQRRIARELGWNRRTVARYGSKCTGQVTPGSGGPGMGSAAVGWASKCTREVTPGAARFRSACEGYREEIQEKVGQGLSAQRIYQDLVSERGFGASYQSVKRFVAGLRAKEPGRVWRLESPPGEEMQVDFGLGAMIEGADGARRRSWVLRAVLSYSRKGYSEAVFRQDAGKFTATGTTETDFPQLAECGVEFLPQTRSPAGQRNIPGGALTQTVREAEAVGTYTGSW